MRTISVGLSAAVLLCAGGLAGAAVVTNPTMDTTALAAALHPVGLTIDSITISNGMPGQFGTYSNFILAPVTIQNGIVLSSGDVSNLGPIPGATEPGYD